MKHKGALVTASVISGLYFLEAYAMIRVEEAGTPYWRIHWVWDSNFMLILKEMFPAVIATIIMFFVIYLSVSSGGRLIFRSRGSSHERPTGTKR